MWLFHSSKPIQKCWKKKLKHLDESEWQKGLISGIKIKKSGGILCVYVRIYKKKTKRKKYPSNDFSLQSKNNQNDIFDSTHIYVIYMHTHTIHSFSGTWYTFYLLLRTMNTLNVLVKSFLNVK